MALDEQQKKQLMIVGGGGVAVVAIIFIMRRGKSSTPPDVSSPLFSLSGTSGPGGGVVGTPTPTPTPGPSPAPGNTCPPGFHRDDAGNCVPSIPPIPLPGQCPPGYHMDRGVCLPDPAPVPHDPNCPPGFHRGDDGQCHIDVPPIPGVCPPGYHLDRGVCVADPNSGGPPDARPGSGQLMDLASMLGISSAKGGPGGSTPSAPIPSLAASSPYDIERTHLWTAVGMYFGQDQ